MLQLKQALQTALDFEQKGHDIYKGTAEKTQNPIVKKTFQYLADQELHHIWEIKKYLEVQEIELKGDKFEQTKKFFSTTVKEFKEKTQLSSDDEESYKTALVLEKNAYDFYQEQYNQTTDPKLKQFFKFLMHQENAHFQLIQKAYDYIKDPVIFNEEEENCMTI